MALRAMPHAMLCLLLVVVAPGLAMAAEQATVEPATGATHPYGWLSLLPPLVAIFLAMVTRRVVWALLVGVLCGALVVSRGNLIEAVAATLETHLWGAVADADHLRVFAFTLLMGAMVGLMSRSAGMQGLVELVRPLARSRRGGQLTTWGLGLIVFFDDYANSVLLGNTLRPVADRLRISREKLAYLVDSTSAPVAGLALVSTWIATEISFINEGLTQAGLAGNPYDLFLATIPYRFYVLLALVFVLLVGLTGRDFGPMLTAERRSLRESDTRAPALFDINAAIVPETHLPPRAINAIGPVLVALGVVVWMLYVTGHAALAEHAPPRDATWQNIISGGDSYQALMYGSLAGMLTAVALVRLQGLVSARQVRGALTAGAGAMLPALVILTLAWALSRVTSDEAFLDAGHYLAGLMSDRVSPPWLPTIVFVIAAATAFSTGTSWGTMGIVTPLSITTAVAVLGGTEAVSAHDPILLATVGSVLAGAIFGDHCSPISDTTVLSSQATGCPHLDHVETQLPYAMVVALVAVVCGTLPVGFGLPPWPLVLLGIAALAGLLYIIGRRPDL